MWALVRATAFAIAIISSSLSAQTARSATYNIDLNTATGVSGTGGGAGWVGPCYCYSTITYGTFYTSADDSHIDGGGQNGIPGLVGPVDVVVSADLPSGFFITPLPPTLLLFASGCAVIGLLGWRRNKIFGAVAN
jgi:hypothetical protein